MPPRVIRHGLPCAPPAHAAIDAARLAPTQRDAVVALDMAAAAGIASLHQVQVAVGELKFATGLGRVRWALGHASQASRSPMETWLRLVRTLDAGFPQPLVNVPVWDQGGSLIGLPDLFDPEAGVAGEYDGAFHRERSRHRRDVSRTEAFRAAGIETFTMVAGDSPETAISRMRSARDRALWLPPGQRRWSLSPSRRQANS